MPIRLNLLAEAQAAEEMRRKDPVKRSLWLAALVISLVLVWSSSLQLKAMVANRELSRIQGQMGAYTNEYQQVLANQQKTDEIKQKLAALRQFSANRFLQASLLNSLQQATVEDVQLIHVKSEQTYALEAATRPKTNENNRVTLGKPASATERIVLTVDANDASSNPGDQVNKLQEALTANPYVGQLLGKSNMISLKHVSPRQLFPTPGSTVNKESVLFTLEARLPEKTR